MSSQSRHSVSSRPPDYNTTGAIGGGSSRCLRGDRSRAVNIPERRLWSHGRPKFHIHDSSGSSQGGSSTSTKSSGGSSTMSDAQGRHVHTVSPYGSFFVEDMDIDGHSPSRGGSRTRGTTADLNRGLYQTSARRAPNGGALGRRQYPMAPGLFETAEPTLIGTPVNGAALQGPGRNAPKEGGLTPSTLATSTHRSKSGLPTSWERVYRDGPHNPQARPHRAVTGTALPPGSSLSKRDRQTARGAVRTTSRR